MAIFDKFSFADKFFEGVSRSFSVRQRLCSSIRNKQSLCKKCSSECPAGCIEVGEVGTAVKVDWDKCSSCGICINVCPTQVFKLRHGGYKAYIKRIAEKITESGELIIKCNEAPNRTNRAAIIDCVGIINVVDILMLYMYGANEISISFDSCSDCENKYGKRVLENELKELSYLRTAFFDLNNLEVREALDRIEITFPKKRPLVKFKEDDTAFEDKAKILGRRGLFNHFADILKTATLKSADAVMADNFEENNYQGEFFHALTPRRELFLEAFMQLGKLSERYMPTGSLFNDIEINESCIYCGICALFCPSGALSINSTKTELTFNASKCLSCGLCERACAHNKILYKDKLDMKYFLDDVIKAKKF